MNMNMTHTNDYLARLPKKLVPVMTCLAIGASSSVSSSVLEEIVVTAQKREQSLQDVGLSVSAFSGDQLKELGYSDTIDIAAQVPGLQLQQFHPSITVFNIRGISQNDFGDQLEAPIAVFTDDAYVGAMGAIHGSLFDVERVEVLRGPQGTLFGRNATGGLIHFVTRKPTEELEGYGMVTLGEYSQIKTEGAISGELSDGLLGRFSFATNRGDGWQKNQIGTDFKQSDSFSVRGQLQFDLSDDATLNLKLQHSETDEIGNTYEVITAEATGVGGTAVITGGPNPITGYERPFNDPHNLAVNDLGYFQKEQSGITANLSWDLDKVSFHSVTDFLSLDKDYKEDADGSPIDFFAFFTEQKYDQFSQEFRLNGEGEQYRWVGGLYYLKMDTENRSFIDINFQDGSGTIPSGVTYELESESYAVFGQVEYDLSDDWMLLGGLRWTEDERQIDSAFTDFLFTSGEPIVFSPNTTDLADQDWSNYSAKLEIDWRPNQDWLYYASVTKGHKAGNFAQPVFATTFSLLPHDEEELVSYEIGFKGEMADGSLRLNGAIFYYDYKDYQAFSLQGLEQAIFNKDASLKGGEVEVTWLTPVEGLEILLGASFLDSEVEDVVLPDGTVKNREMPQAPELSANALVRYGWEALGGQMAVQLDANYNAEAYFSVFNGQEELEDAYTIANAHISYRTDNDQWRLTGFIKNLTDEEFRVYNLDVSALGFIQNAYAPPRTAGVSVEYNF
ncbi:TonB-dependent receptor [Pseudomaricurvus alkylphenolicus]|uniref:TonB-dependent receptor n=1 Tax=Pseudomaricurvus alkylphenolicus TaxID=1306991 RepID=UPI0014216987|nr:TonB-dependent receptor [Pseudomaricurvus alkylphenolicus]NIB38270.1 TonB-dependent receptor [Pseudomaricurvus alkylphenolicus]